MIHRVVYRSPDRLWRIETDRGSTVFALYFNEQFLMHFRSVEDLSAFLSVFKVHLADLDEDQPT